MGYIGQPYRFPFNLAGLQFNRNTDILGDTALVDGTTNINFHEGGVSKRGGSTKYLVSPITSNPAIRGLYQFGMRNGTSYRVFATSSGKVYQNSESNLLKAGMSLSNKFNFSVFNNELYIADGATVPQVWDGVSVSTTAIAGVPTDWSSTSDYPFQIIPHARGANARQWAIRSDAVFASDNDDGDDFSDANVKKIPVYSNSGLVAGYDFNGTIFTFSKTKTYIIDDTSVDTTEWGYKEAIWEGGAAHWRLITKAGNNLYIMTDEGIIYSIRAVQSSGDYESVAINKPSYIDRWLRERVTVSGIENFHCVYHRQLRAIEYFVQVYGSNVNTSLLYFIDRPSEIAFSIHDNTLNPSGYNASVSAEVRLNTGIYTVMTGDFSGNIWDLEQTSRSDDSNTYSCNVKTRKINMELPRVKKHFKSGRLKVASSTNSTVLIRVWVDGVRREDEEIDVIGSGATFDSGLFDTDVFADDTITPYEFDLGYYGYDIQFEIVNDTANEDMFLTELLIDYKTLAVANEPD